MACRVLRGSGKSPRQWLATVDDQTFYDWKAYFDLEPWGDERKLLASIAVSLKRLLALKYSGEDVEKVLNSVDRQAAYLMPASWIDQPEVEDVDTITNFEAVVAGLYG